MKKTSPLLFVLSIFLLSCSNEENDVVPNDVPEAVKSSLTANFSNAMDVEWEKVGNNYEADFDMAGVDHEALIDPAGEMLLYKHDILEIELPDAVTAAINQNYANMQIDDAESLYQGNDTYYQVDLDNSGADVKVVFSPDGQEQTEPAYWD